jgi:BASS family bile acid:Na+ symporter
MLLSPVLVWLILGGVDLPTSLESGIVLMAAGPPILGATSIAILLGLDAALAVVVGLICTLLAPFTVPPLALLLLGLELDIGLADFMLRLGLLVGGAFLGAAIIRRLAGSSRIADYGRHLDGVVVLTMLVFAVAIMDGVTATLLREPATVLLWLVAAFVANPALQILGAALAWKIGRRQSLTVGLVSGNCNMGLLLAALPAGSDPGVALYFAIAQMPMYMLPAVLLPIYRRMLTGVTPSNE